MARQRRGESRGDAVRCSGGRAGRADRVTDRWDAIVVGAGPAGAATALLLSRAGAQVLLLDSARFPRHKPCSEYLSPATTAIDRKSTRLNSSHGYISYAVFCLKKKKQHH